MKFKTSYNFFKKLKNETKQMDTFNKRN
jgi:hypothetical protein